MRTIAFLFSGLFALCGNAQSWCPPGAEWTYFASSLGHKAQIEYVYTSDTILNGVQAQKISKMGTLFNDQTWEVDIYGAMDPEFTSNENDILQLWSSTLQEWDTVFILNALPGDRWHVAFTNCWHGDLIEVVDTGRVLVDGEVLRYWDYQQAIVIFDTVYHVERFTERIAGDRLWLPYDPCTPNDASFFTRRCYRDDETQIGSPEFETLYNRASCDFSTAIPFADEDASKSMIFPNPGTDHFTLNNVTPGATIQVFDAMGKCVHKQRSTGTVMRIDASGSAPGVYHIRISNNAHVQRWMKQ